MKWKHPKIYSRIILGTSALRRAVLAIAILPSWSEAGRADKQPAALALLPPRPFPPVAVESKAVIVWDVKNRKSLYDKNAEEELPLASITKIMTAAVAAEIFAPADIIPINESALGGGGNAGLAAGDNWRVE